MIFVATWIIYKVMSWVYSTNIFKAVIIKSKTFLKIIFAEDAYFIKCKMSKYTCWRLKKLNKLKDKNLVCFESNMFN